MINDRLWIKRVTHQRFELVRARLRLETKENFLFFFTHNPPCPRYQTGRISTSVAIKVEGSWSARKSRLVSLRYVVRALPSVAVRRPLSIRAPASSSLTPPPPSFPFHAFPVVILSFPFILSHYPPPSISPPTLPPPPHPVPCALNPRVPGKSCFATAGTTAHRNVWLFIHFGSERSSPCRNNGLTRPPADTTNPTFDAGHVFVLDGTDRSHRRRVPPPHETVGRGRLALSALVTDGTRDRFYQRSVTSRNARVRRRFNKHTRIISFPCG